MSDEEARVIATFSVEAGTTAEFPLDVTGMTDAQIIAAVEFEGESEVDVQLCNGCEGKVVDPQAGRLTGLVVDGREIDLEGPRR